MRRPLVAPPVFPARPRAAAALLLLGAFALVGCRPAGPRPGPHVEELPSTEPTVRVGIAVDTTEISVGARTRFQVLTLSGRAVGTGEAERPWRFSAAGDEVQLSDASGRSLGRFAEPIQVRAEGGGAVLIGGQPYAGGALVRPAGAGRLTAINLVLMEEYLAGVVPHEIGVRPADEIEAVKAQAIAARTYAISHMGRRDRLGFDFFATVSDQVYRGIGDSDAVTRRAVEETRGEVLTRDGSPVLAYYHSTCGGRTAGIHEVWRSAPIPYLRSIADRIAGTERAYCETSNRFRWSEGWTGEALRGILGRSLGAHLGRGELAIRRVEAIEVVARTESGRVQTLRIRADGQSYDVRGDSTRWVLRPEPGRILNSSYFELDVERDGGEVRYLRVHGGGWGHGIGMCQVGAMGRARAGQSYRTILTAYYQGTEIRRLY